MMWFFKEQWRHTVNGAICQVALGSVLREAKHDAAFGNCIPASGKEIGMIARLICHFVPFSFQIPSSLHTFAMHLTITTHQDDIYNVEVDTQMALEDLKALLEIEVRRHGPLSLKSAHVIFLLLTRTLFIMQCGQPPERQVLFFNGNQLNEAKKTLEQYGIKDYDMLLLQTNQVMSSSR